MREGDVMREGCGVGRVDVGRMTSRRKSALSVVAFCVLLIVGAPYGRAQARFEVSSRESIGAVPGLTVYTLRDTQLGVCFVLFILQPSGASPLDQLLTQQPLPEPSAEQVEKSRVAQILREAAAARDREVEALRRRADTLWTVQYELEFARIQDEYERVVRSVLPGLYPTEQIAAGQRTSGWDDVNAAVWRALAEGDAATAAADRTGAARQLSGTLSGLRDIQRLAAVGPMACSGGANRTGR
jgi:hypothetical protein